MQKPLREHQAKALEELSNGKILWGGVGSGKSRVAVNYYVQNEAPKDVYVVTTARKRDSLDWEEEFVAVKVFKDAAQPGRGVLSVTSWNQIDKLIDISDAFFIFDEQRLVGAGKWSKSFLKIAEKNTWIMLSATPGDTWLDFIPVFLANGFYKNRTEFKREHVVYNHYAKFPKVDRYLGTGKLQRLRKSILVHMPYERHTTRHIVRVDTDYDRELFRQVVKDRWHVYEERPLRDVAELFSVMRKVVNSDASRLERLRDLLARHPRVIVFYNFDYELNLLRGLAKNHLESSLTEGTYTRRSTVSGSTEQIYVDAARSHSTPESLQSSTGSSPTDTKSTPSEKETESCLNQKSSSSSGTSGYPLSKRYGESLEKRSRPTCSSETGEHSKRRLSLEPEPPWTLLSEETPKSWSFTSTPLSPSLLSGEGDMIVRDLRTEPTTSFAIAEWNGHKHEPIPDTESWVYLVQYTAGAEAWNCITTDAVVFYSLPYSYKLFEQAQGRIDRMNTPYEDLYYYVLRGDSLIDQHIWKALSEKKSFNVPKTGGFE